MFNAICLRMCKDQFTRYYLWKNVLTFNYRFFQSQSQTVNYLKQFNVENNSFVHLQAKIQPSGTTRKYARIQVEHKFDAERWYQISDHEKWHRRQNERYASHNIRIISLLARNYCILKMELHSLEQKKKGGKKERQTKTMRLRSYCTFTTVNNTNNALHTRTHICSVCNVYTWHVTVC